MNATKKPELTEKERLVQRAEDRADEANTKKRRFDEAVDLVLSRLERVTSDIRHASQTHQGESESALAELIQHTVLWGVANFGLDALTGRAREADEAARQAADARNAAAAAGKNEEAKQP